MGRVASVFDPVRSQIDPEALALIEATGHVVAPGFRDPGKGDHSPVWDGLDEAFWKRLRRENPASYRRLIAICEEDFPTFCALLLRVYNKSVSRIHPFIFNMSQRFVWNRMAAVIASGAALFLQFLKARQVGVSTFCAGKHFWHTWRERDVNTTVIAHEVRLAKTLVRTFSLFYDELPDCPQIKPRLKQMNRSARIPTSEVHFSFRNDVEWRSNISTQVAKSVEARGERSKHIWESEYAFYPDPKALNDALMPQLPPLGSPARLECSVFIESTPNGQNHFYDLWQLAKSGTSEWVGIFLPWFIAPDLYSVKAPSTWRMTPEEKQLQKELSRTRVNEYDGEIVTRDQMYWRRLTIDAKADDFMDAEQAFDMEYPSDDETCFLLYESHSLFKDDMKYLGSCVNTMEDYARKQCSEYGYTQQAPILGNMKFEALGNPFRDQSAAVKHTVSFVQEPKGRTSIWEFPQSGHVYVAGSDPGDSSDNACTHVTCVTCGQQAAELVTHQDGVEVFCDHTIALCRFYNNALWMPEVNHIGTILLKRGMVDWRYGNVAREEKWDEPALKKNKFGHYTSEHSKPILVSGMKALIADRYYRIASRALRSEMSTFTSGESTGLGNIRYSSKGRNKDDRVMAMGLALRAVRQSPKLYSEMTIKPHTALPSAVALGLNHSEVVYERMHNRVPEAIRFYFEDEASMYASNPIRGDEVMW
jgi:hypothetical protein